jgi:valyl-tRNA synthetase
MARSVDEMIIETVTKIRNVRGEMNIPLSEEMDILINPYAENSDLAPFLHYIKRLARIRNITITTDQTPPKRSAVISTTYGVIYILLEDPHIQKEIDRLLKVAQKLEKEMAGVETRLNNPNFVNAPIEVQTKTRLNYAELEQKKREGLEQISHMQGLLTL